MPGGDRTGPAGRGAGTGWGRGGCVSGNRSFFGFGRGMGRSRGFGRYMPWNWFQNNDPKTELNYLEKMQKNVGEQINSLKEMLSKQNEK